MAVNAIACYEKQLEVHLTQETVDKYPTGLALSKFELVEGSLHFELEAKDGGPKYEKQMRGGEVTYKWRHFFSSTKPRPDEMPLFGMTPVAYTAEMEDYIVVQMPPELNVKKELNNSGKKASPKKVDAPKGDAFPLESELRYAKQIINEAKKQFGEDMDMKFDDKGLLDIDITIRRKI